MWIEEIQGFDRGIGGADRDYQIEGVWRRGNGEEERKCIKEWAITDWLNNGEIEFAECVDALIPS